MDVSWNPCRDMQVGADTSLHTHAYPSHPCHTHAYPSHPCPLSRWLSPVCVRCVVFVRITGVPAALPHRAEQACEHLPPGGHTDARRRHVQAPDAQGACRCESPPLGTASTFCSHNLSLSLSHTHTHARTCAHAGGHVPPRAGRAGRAVAPAAPHAGEDRRGIQGALHARAPRLAPRRWVLLLVRGRSGVSAA
jgi:hypothetical protein